MRIGIDARFYGLGQAGLARYTQELIKYLSRAKTDHTFVVFLRRHDLAQFDITTPNIEVRTTDIPHHTVREQTSLGRELVDAKLDLMHFTNFNFPISYRGKFIISINDLTLLSHAGRGATSRLKAKPLRLVMQRGTARSRKITTLSEHQKELIVEEFGVSPDKIEVIYLGVDAKFKPLPAAKIKTFRKQHGINERYVMYTGQWRAHKNLVRLIKAFRLVRDQLPIKLVLAGKMDAAFPIIPQTIHEAGLTDDVILTDFVSDADLPYYYNAAELFAFPSLTEGFGLPPLEAMACGTPVAASAADPMPEILGSAAAYFNPRSVTDISQTMLELLNKPAQRRRYQKLGHERVKRYSWEQTAAQTLATYEAALDRP